MRGPLFVNRMKSSLGQLENHLWLFSSYLREVEKCSISISELPSDGNVYSYTLVSPQYFGKTWKISISVLKELKVGRAVPPLLHGLHFLLKTFTEYGCLPVCWESRKSQFWVVGLNQNPSCRKCIKTTLRTRSWGSKVSKAGENGRKDIDMVPFLYLPCIPSASLSGPLTSSLLVKWR